MKLTFTGNAITSISHPASTLVATNGVITSGNDAAVIHSSITLIDICSSRQKLKDNKFNTLEILCWLKVKPFVQKAQLHQKEHERFGSHKSRL